MIASLFIVAGTLMTPLDPPTSSTGSTVDAQRLLADFTTAAASPEWYVVNDNVMGGRSAGNFKIEQGELHFAGSTNTRGGGFSSIRTRRVQLDLSQFDGIRLKVRGDGRRYTWRLSTDVHWRGKEISFFADFETESGTWTTVDIPFSRFIPRFRGTTLNGPELDLGQITDMGLMIYDKLDGPFELHLASVHAYSAQALR